MRYGALLGIRNEDGGTTADPTQFPFIVIIGPSGQLTTVPGPSGVAGSNQSNPNSFFGTHHAISHVALAWTRNEIVTSWNNSPGISDSDHMHAWQPYGQTEGSKVNDSGYDYDANVPLDDDAMFDGFNWKIILYSQGGGRQSWSMARMLGGGVFWQALEDDADVTPMSYGFYEGKDPIRTGNQGGGSAPFGWRPRSGLFGEAPQDVISSAHYDNEQGNIVNLGGVRPASTDWSGSRQIIDMIAYRDTIWWVTQQCMVAHKFGGKGQFVYADQGFDDDFVANTDLAANYTQRLTQQVTGTNGRAKSLAVHRDQLFMLSGEGGFFRVYPNRVEKLADLTALGTPWSSGIFSSLHPREPSSSETYVGTSVRRPLLLSFNGQLHAFLNFETDYRLAKGTTTALDTIPKGRGIFYATSFDGENWSDKSTTLPTSGIHSPSGGGVTAGLPQIQVTNWLTFTSPYRFSGFTGPNAQPIPESSGFDYPIGYFNTPIGSDISGIAGVYPARPSGLMQHQLVTWSSGNMIDVLGTQFDSLKVPLEFNSISGFLFPTEVRYPESFIYKHAISGFPLSKQEGGVLLPDGVGPSGFDYTGCSNYHIAGYVDTRKKKMQLCFSKDNHERGALFFEVDASSGWIRRNYATSVEQLNGYIPIMLYDPEIIIPSGDPNLDPNPRIDEANKEITLKYRLYDWPFWDKVNVVSEYSIDGGLSWNFIRKQKNLSTGSPISDPSGVIGTEHSLVWKYADKNNSPHPLSKNAHYPRVQLRLYAEDPDFEPEIGP